MMFAALATASATQPVAIGKPDPMMYELAMAQMNAQPENTAVIGDRADTDILGGKRAGITTICVLSGASDRAEAETVGTDLIFDDIAHLLDTWMTQS